MINKDDEKIISVASLAAPKINIYSVQNGGENIYVYEALIIRLLSQAFRVPFKILLPSDGEGGAKKPDGNWTGEIGMVLRSEVDLAVAIGLNYQRFQDFNLSYPYLYSDVTFMADKLKPDPTSLAIVYPFPLVLWILLIAIILLFSCVLFLHVYRKETYQNILFMLFGSLLEKSIDIKLRKLSLKLIMSTWFIFIFVIINSYKAVLLSIITLPPLTGIRNIADLATAAEQNYVNCYSYKGTGLQQMFLKSGFTTWRSIGKCMQRNVKTSGNAEIDFLKAPPNKAFITRRYYLKPYEEMYFISEDSFYNINIAFAVSRNFCCQNYLNEIIHRFFAAGLFQKIIKDEELSLKLKTTYSDFSEPGRLKILQLQDLKGPFIVLFSGYALSIMVLFFEIAAKRYIPKSHVTLKKKTKEEVFRKCRKH